MSTTSNRLSEAIAWAKKRYPAEACEICGDVSSKRRLAADHDHETGKQRGRLCSRCNTALGLMRDNPYLLHKAAAYLEQHGRIAVKHQSRVEPRAEPKQYPRPSKVERDLETFRLAPYRWLGSDD